MVAALLPWLRPLAIALAGWLLGSLLTAALVVSWLRLRASAQAAVEREGRRTAWREAACARGAGAASLIR